MKMQWQIGDRLENRWEIPRDGEAWANAGMQILQPAISRQTTTYDPVGLQKDLQKALRYFREGHRLGHSAAAKMIAWCQDLATSLKDAEANMWFNNGQGLAKDGRRDEAIACFDRALELNPRSELAWFGKGIILDSNGDAPQALICFEQAARLGHPQANERVAFYRQRLSGS